MNILVPMCADILHVGHINIINRASQFGNITIGLSTDKFIVSLKKRRPIMPFSERETILLNLRFVSDVIPMDGFDIPKGFDMVVHGDDWDPPYVLNGVMYLKIPHTPGISSSKIKEDCK